MKTAKILYWVFTILICALMVFSAVQEIINGPESVKFMAGIGLPAKLNPFLGVAKILGVIAILIPGYPRIKEWAYAGLMFDLIGATYLIISAGAPISGWVFMFIFIGILGASYFLYHKKSETVTTNN